MVGPGVPVASARPAKERQAAAGEQGRQGDHHPAAPAVKREAEQAMEINEFQRR
jgi:hypothetical protein